MKKIMHSVLAVVKSNFIYDVSQDSFFFSSFPLFLSVCVLCATALSYGSHRTTCGSWFLVPTSFLRQGLSCMSASVLHTSWLKSFSAIHLTAGMVELQVCTPHPAQVGFNSGGLAYSAYHPLSPYRLMPL